MSVLKNMVLTRRQKRTGVLRCPQNALQGPFLQRKGGGRYGHSGPPPFRRYIGTFVLLASDFVVHPPTVHHFQQASILHHVTGNGSHTLSADG
jgi:hypothetical protein